jgi:hypothetical protein
MPDLKKALNTRTIGQTTFPNEAVQALFRSSLSRFEVKQSLVAKRGSHCRGLFLRLDASPIPPSAIPIGIYSGKISKGKGVYHLELPSLTIDGSPNPLIPMTCFGMMNEDIYDHKFNVKIMKDGSLIVISTILPGDELLTKYDDEYDWGWIKEEALSELISDITGRFPWVDDLTDSDLGSLKLNPKSPLHSEVLAIINSKCWSERQHSATPSVLWTGPSGLALFLTSGAIYEKYRFGGFGSGKTFSVTSLIPRGKLSDYTDKWNGVSTADLTEEIILKRGSDHIRTLKGLLTNRYKHRPSAIHADLDSLSVTRRSGRITLTFTRDQKKPPSVFSRLLGTHALPRTASPSSKVTKFGAVRLIQIPQNLH